MTKDLEYRVTKLEREVKLLRNIIVRLSSKNEELDSRTHGLIVIGGAYTD